MRMEDMDDFGDLYADLDDQVNTTVGATTPVFTGDGDKSSISKPEEDDSISKESSLCGQIGETNEKELLVSEGEEDNNSSDSDDDLHIVLNEEDCPDLSLQGVNLGNGEMVVDENGDEDEDDDLVIITGTDRRNKDQKWPEQLQLPADRLEPGSAERASASKGGYRNWYVRPHSAGFPSNARNVGPGSAVSFSSSTSGKGEWDQLMMPCSSGTESSNLGIPSVAQNRFDFSLPRNRTIFDVNIEAFGWKPWRHHGVDITDFFNFGLDEESWKSYCKRLDHSRQQATMVMGIPVSSRLNQVLETESQVVMENVKKGEMGFEMPKGRSIRVESGLTERRPSIDIRRPRHRDSDVVIQISMEGSAEGAFVPGKEETEHVEQPVHLDDSVLKSDNEVYEGMLSGDPDGRRGQKISDPDECCYQEVKETVSKGAAEEAKAKPDSKKDDEENLSRAEDSILEAESASGDQVLCSSSSSDVDSHSEASHDGVSLEKVHNPSRKTSLSSVTGLQESIMSDYYLSSDSRSDTTKTEEDDNKDSTHDCHLYRRNHECCSTRRLRSVAEFDVPVDGDEASIQAYRKRQSYGNHLEVSRRPGEKKFDDGGDLSSYRETEMLISHKIRRYAEKQVGSSYSKQSRKEGDQDPYLRRNWDKKDHLLERRAAVRDNGTKQRENYFHERGQEGRRTRVVPLKESVQSTSELRSFYTEKDWYLWQRKKREDNRRVRMEAEYDDIVIEQRCREGYVQEMYGRHRADCDKEEEIFNHMFDGHMSQTARELRSPKRSYKYNRSSCFDLDSSTRYVEDKANNSRHLDHELLVSEDYREPLIADERRWHDGHPPRYYLSDSWRSSERYVHHRKLPNTREIEAMNNIDYHHSPYGKGLDFGDDDYRTEEKSGYPDNIIHSEKRRYNWLAKRRLYSDDEFSFMPRERYNLPSPEVPSRRHWSLRHEKSRINQNPVSGRKKCFDDHQLENARDKIAAEGKAYSEATDHISFGSDIFEKGSHELEAMGFRKGVNTHLNGWNGKSTRRSNGIINGGNRYSDTNQTIDKQLEDFRHTEELHTQKKVSPWSLEVDSNCVRPVSSKLERAKECKSKHSDNHIVKMLPEKYPISQDHDSEALEEGQIIEETDNQDEVSVKENWYSEKKTTCTAVEAIQSDLIKEKNMQLKDSARNNKTIGVYDSSHILETLAKMEKRRERFKESIAPIALKHEPEKSLNPDSDIAILVDQVKQQRPARKRLWGGK